MAPSASLLRRPGAAPMVLAGVIGRLPMGMVGLALTLLIVGQTGSYGLAGAVSAVTTISVALVGPYGARLADRIGQGRALPLLLAVNISSVLLLTAAVSLGWPVPLWFLFAAISGMSIPNIGAMTRARWLRIARNGAERSRAFAMESVADELSFVVGPVIASALALAFFPAAPVLFALAAALIGGLALSLQRRNAPPPSGRPEPGQRVGHVVRFAGIGSLFLVMLALGGFFGSLNVSTIAFAEQSNPAMTGVLLGAFSFGSLVSGVVIGLVRRRWRLVNQVRLGVITLTLMVLPLPFIAVPQAFALIAFTAGLSVSTVMIGVFGLVERMVPNSRITEGLAFTSSGIALGIAGGIALSGQVIDAVGPQYSLGLAAVFAGIAAAIFWARSRSISEIERSADTAEDSAEDSAEDRREPELQAVRG